MTNHRIFHTPSEIEDWVNQHYTSQELQELTMQNNLDSPLAWYKGNGFKCMNYTIRMGFPNSTDPIDLPALQSLLHEHHIPENLVVYRFVDWREFLILLWNTRFGRHYSYPGFLSTTLLKDHYNMEDIKAGRTIIELYVPADCPGTYLPEVVKENPEFEILFPHHCSIRRISWRKYEIVPKQ